MLTMPIPIIIYTAVRQPLSPPRVHSSTRNGESSAPTAKKLCSILSGPDEPRDRKLMIWLL